MQRMTTSRGGRRLSAVALSCLLGLVVLPAVVAPAAAARERPKPPQNVEQGAWWYRKMRIDQAHQTSTGKGATIALIDTGIDTSVPELRGADIRMGLDCRGRRAKPRGGPPASHGTSQAALLVGNGSGNGAGGAGVRGIAPDATVIAYDDDLVPETERLECSSRGLGRMFADAIRRDVDVISVAATMNWDVIKHVKRALDAGVAVVAASGADDVAGNTFPADVVGVVSVIAVDENTQRWKRSRETGYPVISAPGVYVGDGGIFESGWQSQGWTSGSSPATTITSGALALVKARYPEATGNQLVQHLVHYTGGDGPFTWYDDYGFGIVSVTEMLETSPTQWPDENPLGKVVADTVENYPMSASSLVDDAAGADPDQRSTAPEPEQEAAAAGATEGEAAEGGSGIPAWTWPTGGVVAAAVMAGAVASALRTRRGRRPTLASGNETRGA